MEARPKQRSAFDSNFLQTEASEASGFQQTGDIRRCTHMNRAVVQAPACNVFTFTYTPTILGWS